MILLHFDSVYFNYCFSCVSASRTSVTIAVKPVLRGDIWDKEKVILQYRWPLKGGSIHMKLSMTGQEKCDLLIQMT
jgi:hypothetical protein